MWLPLKTRFQLPDPTPSVPTCLFWTPTGPTPHPPQRIFVRSSFHSFNVPGEHFGSHPFLEGEQGQTRVWGLGGLAGGAGPSAPGGGGAFKITPVFLSITPSRQLTPSLASDGCYARVQPELARSQLAAPRPPTRLHARFSPESNRTPKRDEASPNSR